MSGIERQISGRTQSRATLAPFRPMENSVLASRRAAAILVTVVEPPVMPKPTAETPPDAEPRQVSKPAAAKPGATMLGTFFTVVVPLATVSVRVEPDSFWLMLVVVVDGVVEVMLTFPPTSALA